MTNTYLILEDSQAKVTVVVAKEEWERDHLLIVRNVAMGKHLLDTLEGPVTLVLDGELDPGCGFGIDLLKYATTVHRSKIKEVCLITNSMMMRAEMFNLCINNGIKVRSCI